MKIQLYRGREFYREVDATPGRYAFQYRHQQPLTLTHLEAPSEFVPEMRDAIETFTLDEATGHYVSTNVLSLPPWVIQQEMEIARQTDDELRRGRFSRMLA